MVLIFLCIGTVLAFVAAYSMYGEGTLKITIMDMAIWLDQLFAIMVNPNPRRAISPIFYVMTGEHI